MGGPSDLDPFELASIEERRDAADVPRLVQECRRLRRSLAERMRTVPGEARAARPDAARAEAAELDLERAHHLLDELGVPRERRLPGQRDPLEYSLLGRLRLALGEEEPAG